MNEEYLWDKSGEPDSEIQQLEEILGTLRYQPRPLAIPEKLIHRRRKYPPLLAIAATIVIALLAAGLWLRVQSRKTPELHRTSNDQPKAQPTRIAPTPIVVEDKRDLEASTQRQPQKSLASNQERKNNRKELPLSTREREEALAAKEQLMMALRLASEKLNLAQRKTQGPAPPTQIRNQHKVG
jgi:hypothetical protein